MNLNLDLLAAELSEPPVGIVAVGNVFGNPSPVAATSVPSFQLAFQQFAPINLNFIGEMCRYPHGYPIRHSSFREFESLIVESTVLVKFKSFSKSHTVTPLCPSSLLARKLVKGDHRPTAELYRPIYRASEPQRPDLARA